jgi:molecular chaperone DnaK
VAVSEAVKGEDATQIQGATEHLQGLWHRVSETIYQRAQDEQAAADDGTSGNGTSGAGASDEEVVDAEVVDESK